MAAHYPKSMPLNVQISFGYSHFLDLHIMNIPSEGMSLTTSLAYKELSQFDYTSFHSNVAETYKGEYNQRLWFIYSDIKSSQKYPF